jgi:hypothetical protein
VEILHRRQFESPPRVSFVLLDWSCRESLHTLDYLAEQDVPRDGYEILWIEYFGRRDPELRQRIDDARRDGEPDPVDAWIVMEMPGDVCHHKHLMYNVGLIASRGELVCFCDSDAMFRPGFVRSILDAFDLDPQIVLHHDEVRNRSPRFYPFRYPTFEDVLGPGCNNWVNGRTVGLWDEDDPLHTRNYGASMTARRDDLIAVGGADMHVDYLGHVCGPYELTFRLANAGRREVWNCEEFLYHTWHPGQAGTVDYCGPHDGRHMSTTALEAIETGRVLPLRENAAIEALRTGKKLPVAGAGPQGSPGNVDHRGFVSLQPQPPVADLESQLKLAVNPEWMRDWSATAIAALPRFSAKREGSQVRSAFDGRLSGWQQLRLAPLVLKMLLRQYRIKYDKLRHASPSPAASHERRLQRTAALAGNTFRKLRGGFEFLPAALDYSKYLLRTCWLHLAWVRTRGFEETILSGDPHAASIVNRLAALTGVKTVTCRCVEEMRHSNLPVLVAAFHNGPRLRAELTQLGVGDERIVTLS